MCTTGRGTFKSLGILIETTLEVKQEKENAYLVTITDDNQSKTIKNGLNLPGNSHQVKMEKRYSKPPNIKPNGVPGRRPILPTVDMDANEVLKVNSDNTGFVGSCILIRT